jgi:hypothetical protein
MPKPFTLDVSALTCHAAFLGGSGSGKTTAALNLVEQLLLRGIPAILVDRKGDLCGYARPEFTTPLREEAEQAERRKRFLDRVEVVVYTPGHPSGNPLAIPIVPEGIEHLPEWERGQVAQYAASALGGMMGYKDTGQDAARLAILGQAIKLLCTLQPGIPLTLEHLLAFINADDPALLSELGLLEPKHRKKLVDHLQTLLLNKKTLLSMRGERLNALGLFGLAGTKPRKTRLSIISTKFLGDRASVEFWVAQLLLEITRWVSKQPAGKDRLQAILLLDEADLYLPAQRKPATKEPMENLLKRARSAGLGLLLASQSPGDFDYKCRENVATWFLGRIQQKTSLDKLKELLSEYKGDASKLAAQTAGHFYVARNGAVTDVRSHRSLLDTEQLSEERILELARRSRGN